VLPNAKRVIADALAARTKAGTLTSAAAGITEQPAPPPRTRRWPTATGTPTENVDRPPRHGLARLVLARTAAAGRGGRRVHAQVLRAWHDNHPGP
jgi:hypothetical protein